MSINREIYTHTASKQLPPLLQGLIAAELIAPSKRLYLYSPWISNIPILNNSANSFRHINPAWPRGVVHLKEVIEHLLDVGSQIYLFTNMHSHNDEMFQWVRQMRGQGYQNLLGARSKSLHKKGLLGDGYYIKGSMNFTFNGLTVLDERVDFTTEADQVSRAHHEFFYYWENPQNDEREIL